MTVAQSPPPRRPAPLILYFIAPLAVMAFAYAVDVIFGSKFVMLPASGRGIERFAVVTIVFCAAELLFAAFFLGRRRRVAPFASVAVWLFAIMFVAVMSGTFRG